MGLSKSARFYRNNPESYNKKKKKDTAYMTSPKRLKYRKNLKRIRNKAKSEGRDIEGKDYNHQTKTFQSPSTNRGWKEKSRLKGSKRGT